MALLDRIREPTTNCAQTDVHRPPGDSGVAVGSDIGQSGLRSFVCAVSVTSD